MNLTSKNQSKIKHRSQHLPLAFTGLSLGFGGLGNCLALLFTNYGFDASWISYISISFVILIVLMMITRNVLHPKIFRHELNDPLGVTFIPTLTMSIMLISAFIASFDKNRLSGCQITGTILMCLAISIQAILILFFLKSVVKHHILSKNNPAYGSYFVPTVGLITACTVATKFTLLPSTFFQVIWFIGYGFYLISFPLVTYSMLFGTKTEEEKFPSIAVWFAPTNLSPAGFIMSFLLRDSNIHYSPAFLNIMFILTIMCGFVFSIILYLFVFKVFIQNKLVFKPIFCSLTFPCAIGATSMVFAAKYLFVKIAGGDATLTADAAHNFIVYMIWFFGIVGIIFSFVATFIVLYILCRMIIVGIKILFTQKHDNDIHNVYQQNQNNHK